MRHSQKEIAEAFSIGNFELTFAYLSNNIVWDVVGENLFKGKSAVINNCKQTSEYFKSAETNFKTEDSIAADNKVIIRGTGEFKRDGKRINFITACDVYEFNKEGELEKIFSYCIPRNI
jgi:hypothetical protein